MTQSSSNSTVFDLNRLRHLSQLRQVEHVAEVHSTNTLALELAQCGNFSFPLLVVTDSQTSGRGRGANRWWSAEGALTFSVAIDSNALHLAPNRLPLLSLTAGLAIGEAIRALLPDCAIGLKWPNDVFLGGRKVCGILVEVPPETSGRLVIGVGINVNNSFVAAPIELQQIATSIYDTSGLSHDLTDFLIHLIEHLFSQFDQLQTHSDDLKSRWAKYCILDGRTVAIDVAGRIDEGTCRGIHDDGALLLETNDGTKRYYGGVISRFER